MWTKSTNILWWKQGENVLLNSPRAGCFSIKNVNFWKKGFSRLHYPETLVENTIRHFIELKVTEDVRAKQQVSDEHDALIRIVLPVKARKSANVVRHQLGDLSRKIDVDVQLFTQVRRSKDNSSRKNNKLQLLINKTLFIIISVVCVLQTMSASRADRYIDVWRNTSYQQSGKDEHVKDPETREIILKILEKCRSKPDCLIFEMLFILELKQNWKNRVIRSVQK